MTCAFVDGTGSGVAAPAGTETLDLESLLQRGAAGFEGVVLYAPPPGWQRQTEVAAALADGPPAILVRDAAWDGFTPDLLAAACRGVISGFGAAGLRRAVEALAEA